MCILKTWISGCVTVALLLHIYWYSLRSLGVAPTGAASVDPVGLPIVSEFSGGGLVYFGIIPIFIQRENPAADGASRRLPVASSTPRCRRPAPTACGIFDSSPFTALTRAELSFAPQNASRSGDGRESRTRRYLFRLSVVGGSLAVQGEEDATCKRSRPIYLWTTHTSAKECCGSPGAKTVLFGHTSRRI